MSAITTHVLDTALGKPGAGIAVTLEQLDGRAGTLLASGRTDADGRVLDLGPDDRLTAGTYRLTFDTAGYFAATGQRGFFPVVSVSFTLSEPAEHYHIPLLLSPYTYSVYRGS
jgi:5-hydroxyisourate hydrolase